MTARGADRSTLTSGRTTSAASSAAERPTGRPREFDPDEVVEQLALLFWEQGYESTSITDIEARTGLSRSSLYNEWGGKEQLFAAALDAYQARLWQYMLGPVAEGDAGLADVHTFLDRLLAGFAPGAPRGCLMASSIAEFGRRDPAVVAATDTYRSNLDGALRAALDRGVEAGELAAHDLDARARALATWVIGFSVAARSLPGLDQARTEVGAAHRLVDGWRR
jgi:TetR/AcrR family transcriptional repressor of nem operon